MVSVAILSAKESVFLNYTTTDAKGNFYVDDIPKDSIILQLTFLGFTTYSKKLIYKKQLIDLKTIVLKEDVSALNEIVISAVVPIQIKKDTVSFNASFFKVNYDDTIDRLLSKLPGIEIDENGNIVTQGTTVTKVMIDGKEFFGGDPSIVLKNISADAIAKVEIIDQKSDEAELTGVSDGNKEIVINFTLKKDKKNRGFGKPITISLIQKISFLSSVSLIISILRVLIFRVFWKMQTELLMILVMMPTIIFLAIKKV